MRLALVACGLSACTLALDLGDLANGAEKASVSADAGAVVVAEAGPDARPDVVDAARADASPDASKCASGTALAAAAAFIPTTTGGVSCNADFALARDNKFTGLDRGLGDEDVIDGKKVAGCVGVTFDPPARMTHVFARVSAVASACGATPCTSAVEGCGTGHSFSLFTGLTVETLKSAAVVDMEVGDTRDYTTAIRDGARDVGVIVLCREAWGSARDDIGVDVISGVCE